MNIVEQKVYALQLAAERLARVEKWLQCIGHGTVNYGLNITGPGFGITLDKNVTTEIEALVKNILEDERMNLRAKLRQHKLLDEPADDNSIERPIPSTTNDTDRCPAIRGGVETE